MDFNETMKILKKILAMMDKIYHTIVGDDEDEDKDVEEKEEKE